MATKSPLGTLVIDGGNSDVKAMLGHQQIKFPHSIAMVMPSDYHKAFERYGTKNAYDFLKINGESYIVGETAQYFQMMRRTGAPKYTREYYGVLFASTIARIIMSSPENLKNGLTVVASHASRDYEFRPELKQALAGLWDFECGGTRYKFRVVGDVETYEEPYGGYARQAFIREHGRWVTPLFKQSVGVIDIGGGTTGCLIVRGDGTTQPNSEGSAGQGMNDVIERLRQALKQTNKRFAKSVEIPIDRLQSAVQTNVYQGFGKTMDVKQQVDSALSPLLNEVQNLWLSKMNGGASLDKVILTGGGNILLHEKVKQFLDFGDVQLADNLESLQFANVKGAKLFYELLQSEGA